MAPSLDFLPRAVLLPRFYFMRATAMYRGTITPLYTLVSSYLSFGISHLIGLLLVDSLLIVILNICPPYRGPSVHTLISFVIIYLMSRRAMYVAYVRE